MHALCLLGGPEPPGKGIPGLMGEQEPNHFLGVGKAGNNILTRVMGQSGIDIRGHVGFWCIS